MRLKQFLIRLMLMSMVVCTVTFAQGNIKPNDLLVKKNCSVAELTTSSSKENIIEKTRGNGFLLYNFNGGNLTNDVFVSDKKGSMDEALSNYDWPMNAAKIFFEKIEVASQKPKHVQVPDKKQINKKAPTYKEVEGLLNKNTCLACHNAKEKQIGPAFIEIAKRNYSNERILQLIHNPEPQNWPGYSSEMPPLPQVTKADALKIASWINSLK